MAAKPQVPTVPPRAPKQATHTKSLAKKVNDELICAICFSRFDNPKVLPCLHLYCEKCLSAMVDKARDKTKLSCPQCQEVHQVPASGVSGFKTYFTINNLLELLHIHEMTGNEKGRAALTCENCFTESPAVARCLTCSEYMCTECLSFHKKSKRTFSHKITTLEEIKRSDKSAGLRSIGKKKYCLEHEEEVLKLFCKTCQEAICRDCALVKHQTHEYVFVRDLRPQVQEELQGLVEQVKRREKDFHTQIVTVECVLSQNAETLKSSEKAVNDHFQELIDAIEARRVALLAELYNIHEREEKSLVAEKESVSKALARLTNGVRFTEQLLENGDDLEVVTMGTQATDTLEGLAKMPMNRTIGAVIIRTSFDLAAPKAAVEQFGAVDFAIPPLPEDVKVKFSHNKRKEDNRNIEIEVSKRVADKSSSLAKFLEVKVKTKNGEYMDVEMDRISRRKFSLSCSPLKDVECFVSVLFDSVLIKESKVLYEATLRKKHPIFYGYAEIEMVNDSKLPQAAAGKEEPHLTPPQQYPTENDKDKEASPELSAENEQVQEFEEATCTEPPHAQSYRREPFASSSFHTIGSLFRSNLRSTHSSIESHRKSEKKNESQKKRKKSKSIS